MNGALKWGLVQQILTVSSTLTPLTAERPVVRKRRANRWPTATSAAGGVCIVVRSGPTCRRRAEAGSASVWVPNGTPLP